MARKSDLHYARAEIKVTTEEGKDSSFRVELPMLKLTVKDHALHNGVPFKCFHS
jgi:hypothetical protein